MLPNAPTALATLAWPGSLLLQRVRARQGALNERMGGLWTLLDDQGWAASVSPIGSNQKNSYKCWSSLSVCTIVWKPSGSAPVTIKPRGAASNPRAPVCGCACSLLPSTLINNWHQRENERKEKGRGGGWNRGKSLRGRHEVKGERGEPRWLRGEKARTWRWSERGSSGSTRRRVPPPLYK